MAEEKKIKISKELFAEQTKADTSYYSDYYLRPYNPDDLFQKKGNYDLYDDMRDDEQIAALFHLKKLLILDNKWDIVSEDEDVRQFIINILSEIPEGFEKNIYDMLSALEYGFSLTEKVFASEDNKIILKDLKTRPPHSFVFHQNEYGKIEEIQQYTGSGDIFLKCSKFIHYINQSEFDNPYGRSDLNKGVYTAWWSKTHIIKFWNIFLERHGMPTVHGTYPMKYQDQKDELKKILKNIQAKTNIITPEEVKISLLESSGDGIAYKTAIDHYNIQIARKMLIPDLLGYSGEKQAGGSYSLGQEHFGIFYAILEQIRNEIQRLLNREIIRPLVEWNFGKEAKAEFSFLRVDDTKREKNLTMFLEWVRMGKPVSPEAEEWFYQQVEAPFVEMPDKMLEVKPTEKTPMEEMPEDEMDDAEMEEPIEDEKDEEYKEEKYSLESFKINKIKKELDDLEEKHLYEYNKVVANGVNRIIAGAEIIPTKNRIGHIKTLRGLSKAELRSFKNVIVNSMQDSMRAGKESAIGSKRFVTMPTPPDGLDEEELLAWFEEYADTIIDIEAVELLTKAKGILVNGISKGFSTSKIVKLLQIELPRYTENRLELVARTTISRAYNEGRMKEFEELGDEIKAFEYIVIHDSRLSPICRALDSQHAGLYSWDVAKTIQPPNHYRCRSILSAVFNPGDKSIGGIPVGVSEGDGDFLQIAKKNDKSKSK